MEDITNTPDALERQFRDGVATPEDPGDFLRKLLDRTKDNTYENAADIPEGVTPDNLPAVLTERRERTQAAFENMNNIGKDIVDLYKQVCNETGFNPGAVRLYVVGGRVYQKPLGHGSDIDVVITVDNPSQGLQPIYDLKIGEPDDVRRKKITARKEFIQRLEPVLGKYQLLERDKEGNVEGWFLEPKGYGFGDAGAREGWREVTQRGESKQIAILAYTG